MFNLNPAPTFTADVPITRSGGEIQPIEFEFKHKTKTGLQTWLDNMPGRADVDIAEEFIVGWRGVLNAAGDEAPWSREAFMMLCENNPAPAVEILNGYLKALRESRAKN